MFPKLLRCFNVFVLASIAFTTFALADEPAATAEKGKLEPADAIRQSLAKKIDWNFQETPLADVVEFLQGEFKIPVGLDNRAINDLGVTAETPVTFKMSGISAKTALRRLLHELGLTVTLDNEVLSITSPDVADCNLMTVFYNVSDLPAFRRPDGKTVPHFEKLTQIITKTIKPATWDEVGGPANIMDYDAGDVQVLVVSQTWEVHDEISSLIDNLRKLRQWPLAKEEIEKLPPLPPSRPKPQSVGGMMGIGGMGVGGQVGPGMGGMGGQRPGAPAGERPAEMAPAGGNPPPAASPGQGKGMGMF